MGQVTHFLGIKFNWQPQPDNHMYVYLTHETFTDNLIESSGLTDATPVSTPFSSGYDVDAIVHSTTNLSNQRKITNLIKTLVGSLLQISGGTWPDLSSITNIPIKHICDPSLCYNRAAKYAIKYLKVTKSKGIHFPSHQNATILAHLSFPVNPSKLLSLTDANCGAQDQSIPDPSIPQ